MERQVGLSKWEGSHNNSSGNIIGPIKLRKRLQLIHFRRPGIKYRLCHCRADTIVAIGLCVTMRKHDNSKILLYR